MARQNGLAVQAHALLQLDVAVLVLPGIYPRRRVVDVVLILPVVHHGDGEPLLGLHRNGDLLHGGHTVGLPSVAHQAHVVELQGVLLGESVYPYPGVGYLLPGGLPGGYLGNGNQAGIVQGYLYQQPSGGTFRYDVFRIVKWHPDAEECVRPVQHAVPVQVLGVQSAVVLAVVDVLEPHRDGIPGVVAVVVLVWVQVGGAVTRFIHRGYGVQPCVLGAGPDAVGVHVLGIQHSVGPGYQVVAYPLKPVDVLVHPLAQVYVEIGVHGGAGGSHVDGKMGL